jgi:hypothetical protein
LTHRNLLGIVTERAKRNDLGHRKGLIVARLGGRLSGLASLSGRRKQNRQPQRAPNNRIVGSVQGFVGLTLCLSRSDRNGGDRTGISILGIVSKF